MYFNTNIMIRKTKVDYVKVEKLLDEGFNYTEIGKILNVKSGTINCYMLKRKGKVITGNKPIIISKEQQEIIFGSLLGDMHCGKQLKSKNPNFKLEHGIGQLEYLKHKCVLLNDLLTTNEVQIYKRYDDRFKIKNYNACYIQSKANPELELFYKMFYKNKLKHIPEDLTLLTPLAIAIWFMDDGQKFQCGYGICTNSFKINDIQRLCDYLKSKYNIYTTINKKNAIYIKACSKNDFTKLIKEYIIPSMEYKLHEI